MKKVLSGLLISLGLLALVFWSWWGVKWRRWRHEFQFVGTYYEGLAPAQIQDQWGFVDYQKRWVIPARFSSVEGFSEGLACVVVHPAQNEYKVGYINKQGDFVISPRFDMGQSFREGRAVIQTFGEEGIKSGFIDRDGRLITNGYPYDLAKSFSEGFAAVFVRTANASSADEALRNQRIRGRRSTGQWGYINREGQVAIPLQFEAAKFFLGGSRTCEEGWKLGAN